VWLAVVLVAWRLSLALCGQIHKYIDGGNYFPVEIRVAVIPLARLILVIPRSSEESGRTPRTTSA
jgi:hypothetical protein